MIDVNRSAVLSSDDSEMNPALYANLDSKHLLLSNVRIAERYARMVLPFIPRGLPVYQSHGVSHSVGIINSVHDFIKNWKLSLTSTEFCILYCASWLHDVGYIHPATITDRDKHPHISCTILTRDPAFSRMRTDPAFFQALIQVIRYHTSHSDLKSIPLNTTAGRNRLVAAIFLLADSLDLGKDRCPEEVFRLIQDDLDLKSNLHWKAHHNVLGCNFAYPAIELLVEAEDDINFQKRILPHLQDDFDLVHEVFIRYGITPPALSLKKMADSLL
ncbi:MAG: HD domain-containing protein [Methanospirillum sp.]|nr:HD domain-containing protein [Methanospirillum sp.]